MKIEDIIVKIKEKPIIWFLTLLISAYLAGIGTYKGIIEIAKLDTIQAGSYIKKDAIKRDYVSLNNFKELQEKKLKIENEYKKNLFTNDT